MSVQEWHWIEYVETGYVNLKILKEIVEIIKSGKVLSDKHLSIYETHNIQIEAMLRK